MYLLWLSAVDDICEGESLPWGIERRGRGVGVSRWQTYPVVTVRSAQPAPPSHH